MPAHGNVQKRLVVLQIFCASGVHARSGVPVKCAYRSSGAAVKNGCGYPGRTMEKIFRKTRYHLRVRASLTIEAAIALPLFMLFTAAVVYILVIISLQTDIQLSMDEAARSLGKQAYLAEETDSGIALNYLTIRQAILGDGLEERLDASMVSDGSSGFSTVYSDYDDESAILDLVACYSYEIPLFSDTVFSLRFIQRIRSRVWTGEEISGTAGSTSEGQIVYITPSGTVYHTTTSCPYLDLTITAISYDSISSARNRNGRKYTRCYSCFTAASDTVYVTSYGTKYHSSLTCSSLKRTVIAVDISEVGDRSLCSKCGGE